MIDYKKLCEIMLWEKFEGESYEDVFKRQDLKPSQIPDSTLIDVVHANSLENWAKQGKFESLQDLEKEISLILRKAVVNPIMSNKPMQSLFPPIYNFCVFATSTDKRGKLTAEAERIAEVAWYGSLATNRLKEKTDKIFSVAPDADKYSEVAKKIQTIWGFTDVEIDAFRYFICQSRHEGHNPSLNKSLYLSSTKKKTGKTTVARAIASVLNGEKTIEAGSKFESSFNKELQINDHDLPLAVQYNCVILDEAMPKDSRKSYGRVKSMLTSNSCSYNQKYGRIISVEAKRYYIYTSNDDISDFVQDSSERRFIQINMERVPQHLEFDEIYDIWKKFAQNCTPEKDWQKWYNTFEDVVGLESKDIDFYKDELLSNGSILQAVISTTNTTLSQKFFIDLLVTGKATRAERDTIKKAITDIAGEPNRSRWSRKVVEDKLQEFINEQQNQDILDGLEISIYNDLPFNPEQ